MIIIRKCVLSISPLVNRWKPHKSWKAANKKDTYDPMVMMLEG